MEELKAKLQELKGDIQTLREFTPAFTLYTTSHEESTNGLTIAQDTLSVSISQVQSLTAALYNQVYPITMYTCAIYDLIVSGFM